MKRIVSVLLASAMLLTLVSCSKAEETTKKKKKAKKTTEETEETTEEPTDEPTETTEDTTTTTTEERTTSTTAPQGNPVQPLHSSVERIDAGYGRHVDIDGDDYLERISIIMEYIEFTSDEVPELYTAVNDVYDSLQLDLESTYDSMVKELDAGKSPEWYSTSSYTTLYRDDTYLFSFAMMQNDKLPGDHPAVETHTYWSKTAEEVKLSDVITDMDSVIPVVKEYVELCYYADMMDELEPQLRDFSCPFALSYDAIYFFYANSPIKIPIRDIPNSVNYSFFGMAPDEYFLELDGKSSLQWDLDGDGVPEDLSIEGIYKNPNDSTLLTGLTIHHNGKDTVIEDEIIWGELHPTENRDFIMKSQDGIFLYVQVGVDEGRSYVIFEYKNGEWTNASQFENDAFFYSRPYDPQNVVLSTGSFLHMYWWYSYYSLEGHPTDPQFETILYYGMTWIFEANTDIPCYRLDDDFNVTGEEVIPKGSIICLKMYDPEINQFLINVCHADYTEDYYVTVDVEENPNVTISGIPLEEALNGLY